MTYAETLNWLYQQLPMFSRIGAAAYKKDLHNTLALCQFLHHPEKKFRSIHIAGTNGKGSTSHMLASVLQAAGYKTGLYTSPHIYDFRERIRINGAMVPEEYVVDFAARIQSICTDIQPSFFELTVAMAFAYFAEQQVDVAVIETGLGGRLDSTNIITPELSVITNIGYDHMNMLGNTLPEIAAEKAGIIKPGVPVVVGESAVETDPVFLHKAESVKAPLRFGPELYRVISVRAEGSLQQVSVVDQSTGQTEMYQLDLLGAYQQQNIVTVLSAIQQLQNAGFRLSSEQVKEGLQTVKSRTGLAGRWDIWRVSPTVITDVGHNEDGIKRILQQLKTDYPDRRHHFILGFVQDKDLNKVLPLFDPNQSYYFTQAHIPRALPHEQLRETAHSFGLSGNNYAHVNDAIQAALKAAAKTDVIIVCGSFFVLAELDQSLVHCVA
ncbi:MAG TPA: folylpolyglutamate synthase/dihydrofolate synthase family protein [Ferruginibacter sp.]|nr:folylpolyglutamate synthase/dihydrofolate synthase family protein [Ferruginibacter sp.]